MTRQIDAAQLILRAILYTLGTLMVSLVLLSAALPVNAGEYAANLTQQASRVQLVLHELGQSDTVQLILGR